MPYSWDSLPFATNQPIERYRLHHRMDLATFAAWLGLTPDALQKLLAAHAGRGDPDFPRLRAAITAHLRELLGLAPDAAWDIEAWARAVLDIPRERWPGRRSEDESG